jgi:16S rRNA (guanine527-N7)-methyltransferase
VPTLAPERITELVAPFLLPLPFPPPPSLYNQLATYLDLLLRWNARTNLTAIRDPERIVERHFGESLFAGAHLAQCLATTATLLDLGSGAGFPGLPIQLLLPNLQVTLAESQGKKAAFLREAVRTLGLKTEVWDRRVELMPESRHFDCVALRAVDDMQLARTLASNRVATGGYLALFEANPTPDSTEISYPIPGTQNSFLTIRKT